MLAAWLLAPCQAGDAPQQLTLTDAWVRAPAPGMGMTAGFGKLANNGAGPIEIAGYSSPSFGDVSLHRTEMSDGMSRMREVSSLSLEAGEVLELAPGGYHLMLMSPTAPIEPGGAVTIEFTASDGRKFRFEAPVERR
jgi:copper(I)-binding protein